MKHTVIIITSLLLLVACKSTRDKQVERVEQLQKELLGDANNKKVDTAKVNELLALYESYAKDNPTDTLSAEYLFKAADFYRFLSKPIKSISIYENIYHNFPTSNKRAYSLFLQGFVFENELRNPFGAKEKYEKFLAEFPDHPIAKDVRLSVQNLGKTPEQLVAEFEARADSVHRADSLAGTQAAK